MQGTIELDGATYDVAVSRRGDGWMVTVDGHEIPVSLQRNGVGMLVEAGGRTVHVEVGPRGCRIDGTPRSWRIASVSTADESMGAAGHGARIRPPMNGKIDRILVQPGQMVTHGDILFVLEAMKMQNEVRSPVSGRVAAVHGAAGSVVEPSQVVVEIEPA